MTTAVLLTGLQELLAERDRLRALAARQEAVLRRICARLHHPIDNDEPHAAAEEAVSRGMGRGLLPMREIMVVNRHAPR